MQISITKCKLKCFKQEFVGWTLHTHPVIGSFPVGYDGIDELHTVDPSPVSLWFGRYTILPYKASSQGYIVPE